MSCLCKSSIWKRELVPSWLEEQRCSPSPGRTGVHCSRVTWGLRVPAASFPAAASLGQRGAERGERACVGGSFLPLLLLPDQYLSVFPLLLRYHQPVGTRNVFIYMVWPGEHSQFPILKKKKRSLRFKVIFESVCIFLSRRKEKDD